MNTFHILKLLVFGSIIIITPLSLLSQENVEYFSPGDSLIIRENSGNFYTNHIFKKQQTIYSLARYYKCDASQIISLNPVLNERIVEIGDTIIVPFQKGLMVENLATLTNDNYIPCYYDVKKKETLFRIARRHFDVSISHLRKLNNLKGNDISIGSKLLVGWFHMTWEKEIEMTADSLILSEKPESVSIGLPVLVPTEGKLVVTEKGAALINQNAGSGIFALHATAAPGSFIEITHPTSRRSMQVKVLAKLPENTYTKDVKIVVSPAVANMLGAESSRFFVLLRYLQNK